jgi:hypothetical protein
LESSQQKLFAMELHEHEKRITFNAFVPAAWGRYQKETYGRIL